MIVRLQNNPGKVSRHGSSLPDYGNAFISVNDYLNGTYYIFLTKNDGSFMLFTLHSSPETLRRFLIL